MSMTMNKTQLLENALASYQAAANELIAELKRQRNEARKQNAQLRDISERAIALAALDEENDKYGAVSQLRIDLNQVKEDAK